MKKSTILLLYRLSLNFVNNKALLFYVLCISFSNSFGQIPPLLNFTDLVSGPSTGLNDGLGEGTLITIWGQNLGSSIGDSEIKFRDSAGEVHDMSYIYYWKNADGQLPGGPSDLYTPLKMQEIAVSLPNAPLGEGEIFVVVNGLVSNVLTFTVREGAIYHVKANGDNFNGDGSYNNPWANISIDVNGAFSHIDGGEIIYVHDGVEDISPITTGQSGRGIFVSHLNSSLELQTGLVAYPNSRVLAQGRNRGINFWQSSGFVVSKYIAKAGNYPVPEPGDDQPLGGSIDVCYGIETNQNGRLIGNYITGIENTCQDGGAGAIVGARSNISNCKMFGNKIEDWGCDLTSKFEHTTYFTVRQSGLFVEPYEFGWNYLLNNKAKYGIHQYDESFSGDCGGFTGVVKIHDNVVENQRGGGLSIGSAESSSGGGDGVCWDNEWEIFNNIFINTGLGPVDFPAEGLNVSAAAIDINDAAMGGNIRIFHNLIYGFGLGDSNFPDQGSHAAVEVTFGDRENLNIIMSNNIFYDIYDSTLTYFDDGRENNTDEYVLSNNLYFSDSNSGILPPNFEPGAVEIDPNLSQQGSWFSIDSEDSYLIDNASLMYVKHDIYGVPRYNSPDIGPIELFQDATLSVPNDLIMLNFTMYPNPTSKELNLIFNRLIIDGSINIIDVNGRTVNRSKMSNQESVKLDIQDLSPGIYFVSFKSIDQNITRKLLIN